MEQRPTWDDGKEGNYGNDPVVNGLLNLKLKTSILLGKNLKSAGSSKLGPWEVFYWFRLTGLWSSSTWNYAGSGHCSRHPVGGESKDYKVQKKRTMNQVTSKTIEQVQDDKVATPLWSELWPWSWELWVQPEPRLGTQVFTRSSYILSIFGLNTFLPFPTLDLGRRKVKVFMDFQTPFLISKVLIF